MIADGSRLDAQTIRSESRGQAYEVFATLYLEPPSPELLAGVLAWAETSPGDQDLRGAGIEYLRHYARAAGETIEALRQEFDDLFVVPLGRYVAPYESVYRDERTIGEATVRGLLMGPSTLSVLSAYREERLTVDAASCELPDHIGVELAFMGQLCRREQDARSAGDMSRAKQLMGRQLRFLEDHLLRWVPQLNARICRHTSSDFFRGVACLSEEFLRADAAALASVTDG